MNSFIKRLIIFIFPLAGCLIGVFLIPFDKEFAHNYIEGECLARGKWMYDRLYHDNKPIDVAFLGTSVGLGLFDDGAVTDLLSEKAGRPIVAANLSFCQYGMNLRNLIVQELLATKSPDHIIMELRAQPNMGGHPLFGYVADNSMLFFPATHLYQSFGTDVYHSFQVRRARLLSLLVPNKPFLIDTAQFGFVPPTHRSAIDHVTSIAAKNAAKDPFPEPTIQQRIHRYVYWKNLQNIVVRCQNAGVQLNFFFLDHVGRRSSVPQSLGRLEKMAPIWFPPDSVIDNPANYADPAHFNVKGFDALSPFLLSEVSALYE